jgi:hypothetical protein
MNKMKHFSNKNTKQFKKKKKTIFRYFPKNVLKMQMLIFSDVNADLLFIKTTKNITQN